MRPLFTDELLDDLEPVHGPDKDPRTEPVSEEAGDFEAALFTLTELLEYRPYSKLKLSRNERSSIALAASAPPLPEGAKRARTIDRRLKDLLNDAKRDSKANFREPIKPKRGRFRPTLRYDYQRRVAPSKVVEDAISLSYLREDEIQVDDPQDDYIAVLDRRHGSEAEDSIQEQPFGVTPSEESNRVRLKLSATIFESGPWLADLTADGLQAFVLRRKGLNQTEIGEAMSPKRSQEAVSRILKSVEQKQSAAMMATFRRTGGA